MIKAVVFDAYGTLFDVYSIHEECARIFGDAEATKLTRLWRSKQLEYTWLRSLMGRYQDFAAVTEQALKYSCHDLGLKLDPESRAFLMAGYFHLSAYPEVPDVLRELDKYQLMILSNGSPSMLAAAVGSAGIADLIDRIISVDPVRVFKPSPEVYSLVVEGSEITSREVAFVSSNSFDVLGAASFGFTSIWVNRYGGTLDELGYEPALVLDDLSALPGQLDSGF